MAEKKMAQIGQEIEEKWLLHIHLPDMHIYDVVKIRQLRQLCLIFVMGLFCEKRNLGRWIRVARASKR
jgi:hypothetical protein